MLLLRPERSPSAELPVAQMKYWIFIGFSVGFTLGMIMLVQVMFA